MHAISGLVFHDDTGVPALRPLPPVRSSVRPALLRYTVAEEGLVAYVSARPAPVAVVPVPVGCGGGPVPVPRAALRACARRWLRRRRPQFRGSGRRRRV